ncbi:copper homeostasis protein CutC [Fusibacter sp. 3D3]|uniref:copper homeostasis protein CutC n=1 Tax=Fusibacter sp. 3D3 TaxID=1048380 RepID=UPI000852BCBC|nr:copper homeostasis protein CutC [Fusibacter sp. 3D3]GAU75748.1 cytoplasmic copper homeostasis protein cutC [Fusibacter sp. 3D3]
MIIREACIGSFEMACIAEQNGADRLEVCERLDIGGVTPSLEMLIMTRQKIKIPLVAIIRPRGGDFIYTPSEFDGMLKRIERCKVLSYNGIAVGTLTRHGEIDKSYMKAVMEATEGMEVTFHMAFDACKDMFESMDFLKEIGVKRILTKGGKLSAFKNIDQIRTLNLASKDEIIIMPGGGVTKDNYLELIEKTGVFEVHGTKIV